ncbi:MAG: glycosyltransferase family 4 protein [Candidatus Latescibacteria bacterium]|jgi:glycosyltransferase involved in cell wall biosynthesis|nr:glycosyltransferase family 4 protein [Candidatus Latescibacterota bacterium]
MSIQSDVRLKGKDRLIHIATVNELNSESGQGYRLHQLVSNMARECSIHLLAPGTESTDNPPGGLVHEILDPGTGLNAFVGNPFSIGRMGTFMRLIFRLRAFLKDARVLYTDTPLALLCAQISAPGRPRVMEINGILCEEWLNKGRIKHRQDIRFKIMRQIEAFTYRNARHLIAVSPGIRDYVTKEFRVNPLRVTVIPNGINEGLLETPLEGKSSDPELGNTPPTALFVGSFRSWHGIENVIRSLPYALESVSNLRLLLVGDGPTRQECTELVRSLGLQDSVEFTGHQIPAQVAAHLAAADLCVYYPAYDVTNYGFMGDPIKLREYMAAGKPIVTICLPNFASEIEKENCGVLVAPDYRLFGEAMAAVVEAPARSGRLGLNGRNAARKFVWGTISSQILDVINEAAG